MLINHSTNTAALASSTGMTEQVEGSISKVLLLNGDANSALAALLSNLEAIMDLPETCLAGNQKAALLELRKAAYLY